MNRSCHVSAAFVCWRESSSLSIQDRERSAGPRGDEDLLRLAGELRQIVRGQLALAAIAAPPDGSDCGQIDSWSATAEESMQALWQSVSPGSGPVEVGAWVGDPMRSGGPPRSTARWTC